MLDGAVKTIMVDDSKTVGELLVTICSRIGNNHLPWLLLRCLCCLCLPLFWLLSLLPNYNIQLYANYINPVYVITTQLKMNFYTFSLDNLHLQCLRSHEV